MDRKIKKEFQEKIQKELLKKKKNLEKRVKEVRESDPFLDPDHVNDNAAIDTDVREQIGHETVEAQINALEKNLNEINLALEKIAKRKWGRCEKCQNQIDPARLKLLPEARFCVECEKKLKKSS